MLEKAFKEGCEHGYKKAMREAGFDEKVEVFIEEATEKALRKRLKNSRKDISNGS